MTYYGIMQGRLVAPVDGKIQTFPRQDWAEEFPRAAQAGLDAIEWIFDLYGEDANPICTDAGLAHLRQLSERYSVQVRSLCADYFMDRPLLRAEPGELERRIERLEWLLGQCGKLGMQRIVLPFVDASAIYNEAEEQGVVEVLRRVLAAAEANRVEIHLETSLAPEPFRRLLYEQLPHPYLKANYDSGNSASLGYKPQDEFAAYGERIGSVHIKDRKMGGGTVPLGTGDTDLKGVFAGLKRLGYQGDFILQVARGETGDEVAWARQNLAFVRQSWAEAA